jgi:hypothetical protein
MPNPRPTHSHPSDSAARHTPLASPRSCGSSTRTRTRTTMGFLTKARNDRRQTGSTSSPAARCGGRRPAGAGSDTAAAAHRWPSSPDARLQCGPPDPRVRGTSGRSPRSGRPTSPRAGPGRGSQAGCPAGLGGPPDTDADQHRKQALDLTEGSSEGPAEGTVRPHEPILEGWAATHRYRLDGRS